MNPNVQLIACFDNHPNNTTVQQIAAGHRPPEAAFRRPKQAQAVFAGPFVNRQATFQQAHLDLVVDLKRREWSDYDIAKVLGCTRRDAVVTTIWAFVNSNSAVTRKQEAALRAARDGDKTCHNIRERQLGSAVN